MLKYIGYAIWAAAAGALIPVMAVLNARLGRTLGEAMHAPIVLFVVGLTTAVIIGLLATGRLPNFSLLAQSAAIDFSGGLIVVGYVISVTLLAPRFGVGNAILFVMTAQVITSAAIDHYGLFGVIARPVGGVRMLGLVVMLAGLFIAQLAQSKSE